ncbi:hypothetical protein NLJ89_g5652 [Agrocybe chaxingu]|uniref:C2H2-type domain-containing protein n=1 Tax=Agrocybe chaxingu TaxID=84603 RepID=A0A9W8MVE2_9AGAR|nr:hypothetical protein NLJ89_g5652 [Agrocybe chaxingu]
MSFFKREYGGFGDMEGNMRDDMDDDMDGDLDDVFDSPFMQMFLLMEPVSREIVAAHEREGGSHCPACGEYQDSWFDLDDHIRDEFNHHVCMDCRIAFPRRHVLLEHYINDPKHFFCETCEDLFLNQKFLDWHIQQFHAYCYRCQKMLDDKNALKRHYILSDDHHYCISCDKSFDSHLDLQQVGTYSTFGHPSAFVFNMYPASFLVHSPSQDHPMQF